MDASLPHMDGGVYHGPLPAEIGIVPVVVNARNDAPEKSPPTVDGPPLEIVHFSTKRWNDVQRVGFRKTSGHMCRVLANHPRVSHVWYVQTDRRLGWTLDKQEVGEKLTVLSLPNGTTANHTFGIKSINRLLHASLLAKALPPRQDHVRRVYWFYDWFDSELVRLLPRELTVMELTDSAAECYAHKNRMLAELAKAQDVARQLVDLTIVVSPRLGREMEGANGAVAALSNGIAQEFLDRARTPQPRPAEMAAVTGPCLGVVGAQWSLNHRVDHGLLEKFLELMPDWHVVVLGCDQLEDDNMRRLAEHPRVHVFGLQPQMNLPAWIQHFDVCAIPYTHSDRRGDALKTYEYLACRKPVVVTDDDVSPELVPFVNKVQDASSFAAVCRKLTSQAVDVTAIDSILDGLTWEHRVNRCIAQIDECLVRGRASHAVAPT